MNPQDQDTIRELVESAAVEPEPSAAVEPEPEPSAETQPEPDPAAFTKVDSATTPIQVTTTAPHGWLAPGVLTSTTADLQLARGDRISIALTGTLPLAPEESHLTLDDAKAIREAMEPFMRSHTVDRRHPAVALADQALAKHGLRFELWHYVPDGHYLDLQHSRIVKEGEYIEPVSKQPVPIPEGKRYDRHEGKLRG